SIEAEDRRRRVDVTTGDRCDVGQREEPVFYPKVDPAQGFFGNKAPAALGIDRSAIIATLQAQNAVTQSGFVETGPERVALRVGG
ncbi:hypothetical protein ACC675_37460, partial [Rhizobium ruizarguesonis]